MGKSKDKRKRKVVVDNSETEQIKLDLSQFGNLDSYHGTNALALPSKKRKTTIVHDKSAPNEKLLSKKQRKRLELVVNRRQKKADRSSLLEELQKHQLPPETLAKFTPLVQVQTEGLKKLFSEANKNNTPAQRAVTAIKKSTPRSSIKGANKQKFRSWSGRFKPGAANKLVKDPKVLGFDESESESSDDEEEIGESSEIIVEKDNSNSEILNEDEIKQPLEEEENSEQISQNGNKAQQQTSESIQVPKKKPDKAIATKKIFVKVDRTKEIEAIRNKLPIIPEEHVIMEAISESLVVVLAGETGSGKTTQVPQFLYEAGFALDGKLIGITEPRRVAAISMSQRVAKELNVGTDIVSYQIRFEGNVTDKTQIKFMTDGVLLKEMERDFLLSKYSAICIDEAHERSLYTDILIGLLSRCILIRKKKNNPLKLVIMSATMRVEDFVKNSLLFKTPPRLIHIPTRQFPVHIHFSKTTPENYLTAALKKTTQIHKRLPAGGILIFVTGQQEVKTLIKQLKKLFPANNNSRSNNSFHSDTPEVSSTKNERFKNKKTNKGKKSTQDISKSFLKNFDLDAINICPPQAEDSDENDDSDNEDNNFDDILDMEDEEETSTEPMHILPLYSMLPTKEQQKVFAPPPGGSRLCVVSTNVAETSLTIPSVRYVIDCGRVKLKVWDKLTGVQQFKITWCSKASAEQRSGRAGRVGPGHCYRLYSSAVYDSEFEQFPSPEIQVRPVDDMVLLMKSMSIDRVRNFPFPSHPGIDQLIAAENTLLNLGALESNSPMKDINESLARITQLGKTMSKFPLGPRFAKMLALSFHHGLVEHCIALVAGLSVQEVFIDTSSSSDGNVDKAQRTYLTQLRRKWLGTSSTLLLGDVTLLLRAICTFDEHEGRPLICQQYGLRFKAMTEIRKLRKQLTNELNLLLSQQGQNSSNNLEINLSPKLKPPTQEESNLLRQIVLSGLPDRIAKKMEESELPGDAEEKRKYKHAYKCGELVDPVFIHSYSGLKTVEPQWVVYQEVFELNGKKFIRGVTAIDPLWIPKFCESLCKMEPPLKDPPPFYENVSGNVYAHMKMTYGKQAWELPIMPVEYPKCLNKIKLFAQFLLEGEIYPKLAQWRPQLLSLPVTMTKYWAKLQPRTQTLLQTLLKHGIESKKDLDAKWLGNDKNFLLEQYLEWLPSEVHGEVMLQWPPINE